MLLQAAHSFHDALEEERTPQHADFMRQLVKEELAKALQITLDSFVGGVADSRGGPDENQLRLKLNRPSDEAGDDLEDDENAEDWDLTNVTSRSFSTGRRTTLRSSKPRKASVNSVTSVTQLAQQASPPHSQQYKQHDEPMSHRFDSSRKQRFDDKKPEAAPHSKSDRHEEPRHDQLFELPLLRLDPEFRENNAPTHNTGVRAMESSVDDSFPLLLHIDPDEKRVTPAATDDASFRGFPLLTLDSNSNTHAKPSKPFNQDVPTPRLIPFDHQDLQSVVPREPELVLPSPEDLLEFLRSKHQPAAPPAMLHSQPSNTHKPQPVSQHVVQPNFPLLQLPGQTASSVTPRLGDELMCVPPPPPHLTPREQILEFCGKNLLRLDDADKNEATPSTARPLSETDEPKKKRDKSSRRRKKRSSSSASASSFSSSSSSKSSSKMQKRKNKSKKKKKHAAKSKGPPHSSHSHNRDKHEVEVQCDQLGEQEAHWEQQEREFQTIFQGYAINRDGVQDLLGESQRRAHDQKSSEQLRHSIGKAQFDFSRPAILPPDMLDSLFFVDYQVGCPERKLFDAVVSIGDYDEELADANNANAIKLDQLELKPGREIAAAPPANQMRADLEPPEQPGDAIRQFNERILAAQLDLSDHEHDDAIRNKAIKADIRKNFAVMDERLQSLQHMSDQVERKLIGSQQLLDQIGLEIGAQTGAAAPEVQSDVPPHPISPSSPRMLAEADTEPATADGQKEIQSSLASRRSSLAGKPTRNANEDDDMKTSNEKSVAESPSSHSITLDAKPDSPIAVQPQAVESTEKNTDQHQSYMTRLRRRICEDHIGPKRTPEQQASIARFMAEKRRQTLQRANKSGAQQQHNKKRHPDVLNSHQLKRSLQHLENDRQTRNAELQSAMQKQTLNFAVQNLALSKQLSDQLLANENLSAGPSAATASKQPTFTANKSVDRQRRAAPQTRKFQPQNRQHSHTDAAAIPANHHQEIDNEYDDYLSQVMELSEQDAFLMYQQSMMRDDGGVSSRRTHKSPPTMSNQKMPSKPQTTRDRSIQSQSSANRRRPIVAQQTTYAQRLKQLQQKMDGAGGAAKTRRRASSANPTYRNRAHMVSALRSMRQYPGSTSNLPSATSRSASKKPAAQTTTYAQRLQALNRNQSANTNHQKKKVAIPRTAQIGAPKQRQTGAAPTTAPVGSDRRSSSPTVSMTVTAFSLDNGGYPDLYDERGASDVIVGDDEELSLWSPPSQVRRLLYDIENEGDQKQDSDRRRSKRRPAANQMTPGNDAAAIQNDDGASYVSKNTTDLLDSSMSAHSNSEIDWDQVYDLVNGGAPVPDAMNNI